MTLTRGKTFVASIVLALLIVGAGAGIWAMFFRDDAPPPASLADAVASVNTATPAESEPESSAQPTDDTSEDASGASTNAGSTWTVAAGSDTFVGYRVGEVLANIGTSEAVGRTSAVSGTVEIAGSQVAAASFEADMTQLRSDDSRRDQTLGDRGLETNIYPTAGFVLAEPIDLGSEPVDGAIYSAIATGDLTLHGVTQRVEIPLEAQFTDGVLVIVGSLEIQMVDYNITPPTTTIALSVEGHGILEIQIILTASA